MRNFSLTLSSVLIALMYVSLEQPGLSVPFLVFGVLLIENSLQIGKKSTGRMLSGSMLSDFRFRYAETQSILMYAISLVIAFTAYALVRNIYAIDLVPYALIAYALLFVVFRVGTISISQYFEKATTTTTSDYHQKLDQRNTTETLKKELDILLGQCLVDSSSDALNTMLLDSRKALIYSSSPAESLKPLMQEMSNAIQKGDYTEASELLRKINLLI